MVRIQSNSCVLNKAVVLDEVERVTGWHEMRRFRGNFWRRALLKNKYVVLFLAVTSVVLVPLWPVRGDEPNKIQFLVAYFGVVALYWAINRLPSRASGPYSWNYSLPDRVREIAALVSTCRKSLVIVSGVFYDEVWGSREVQSALRAIPSGTLVRVFHTGASIESLAFREWVQEYRATVQHLDEAIAHRIIVDDLNVRIEFAERGHLELFGKGRPAMFMYGEPEVARKALAGLEQAIARQTALAA